ncbi:MAG: METTL5 family protein [Ignisphaera sp.]
MVKSRKELEILLSQVPDFKNHMILLEQYVCDSSIASELIWLAYMHNDIENKVVVDLGCGTGILSYGALLMGAKEVLCIDIDLNALKIANNFLVENKDRLVIINADVENIHLRGVHTVIMNPPFGVHRKGIDIVFLRRALNVRPRSVYTIHKYNPESHRIIYEIALSYGYRVIDMAIRDMRIPAIYRMHRKRIHKFKVALYAISKR